MTNETNPTLDQDQLAKRWGIHPRTLEGWRLQKKGPPYFRLHEGKRAPVRYRLEDVEQYERDQRAGEVI